MKPTGSPCDPGKDYLNNNLQRRNKIQKNLFRVSLIFEEQGYLPGLRTSWKFFTIDICFNDVFQR